MRDNIIYNFKNRLKRHNILFDVARALFGGSAVGMGPKKAISGVKGKIVNLGSGSQRIRRDVINLDKYPYYNVDIVGDIYNLPFSEGEVDAIICDQVLEHLENPAAALKEMNRVLKKGGLVYIALPFVAGFHGSPNDYYRLTRNGLEAIMGQCGFSMTESGINYGPTSALLSVFNRWLAIILSFGSGSLYQVLLMIFMGLTFPLKFIDYLIYKFPPAENIAYGVYYLGKKI